MRNPKDLGTYRRLRAAPLVLLLVWLAPARILPAQASAGPTTRPSGQAEIPVDFPSLAEARKAIVDESVEPYFKLLQPLEMSVKTGSPITGDTLQQQRDECRRRYQAAVREFTPQEKDALRWYVSKLVPLVREDYPLYARTPWSFLKLASKLEGSMPHTRGPHIVLSEAVVASMTNSKSAVPEWLALERSGELLLHEQMHVVQREHPDCFAKLYTQTWGFKRAAEIRGCEWLTERQLVNPDGVDVRWVYPLRQGEQTRWIWPLIVLANVQDPARASFADARFVAIELEPDGENQFQVKVAPDGRPQMQPLLSLSQYVDAFRPSSNIYHPNEAAADLFARMVITAKVLPGHLPHEADDALRKARTHFAPLRQAFRETLAEGG